MYTEYQARTVQHLLDAEWIIAVQEAMTDYPDSLPLVVEPAVMGQYDAEQGNPCDPTGRGYRTLGDTEAYIVAYRDTTALWAEMVEAQNAERAHNDDERELMEDIFFSMRGAW